MSEDWLSRSTSVPNRMLCEVTDIQGQTMTLGGKEFLVTTHRDIGEWLATYLHHIREDEDRAFCTCGWGVNTDDAHWRWESIAAHWYDAKEECADFAERGRLGIF